ncbi:uncharacterized protein LOC133532631 [Cydia pomonella]|uniref:uncharacterized protein LOC133532631 n=1 Tax=Cydia pomonella TaxID=82600 RepID=UPI002ADD839E|nr:uncharacterized protein LOC133532631 [Cydia pomonella]XP_061727372.1 uncharacterized protein LOC133532631 [Cydia pomonella]
MQRNDRWPSDYDPDPRSRRGSASSRGSKKKKSPPASATSTPKKVTKPQNLDFVVTGKQLLKKGDRANSLPGSYRRRPSLDTPKTRKPPSPKKLTESQSSKSQETSLEDDVSLELSQVSLGTPRTQKPSPKTLSNESRSSKRDTSMEDMTLELSQVSDFEDTNSKYGVKKFSALATSTPKKRASLPQPCKRDKDRGQSGQSGQKTGRSVSVFRPPSVSYRHGPSTEPDYSSVSPEYSQSSVETSPAQTKMECSQDLSSCCVSTWLEDSDDTRVEETRRADGEWNTFWVNYNNSIATVPMKSYYDQCPTPYRTENIDLADLDFSETSRKRSPEDMKNINSIIRNEGLHLTPRETQNIIKCAHILGNVLSKAIERRSREKEEPDKVQELQAETEADTEKDQKKKTMTLDLKETNVPAEVKEEKRSETVTTQTDISLPNTKSAPRIFENILRQLSRSSIDEASLRKAKESLEVEKNKINEKKEETDKKEEKSESK